MRAAALIVLVALLALLPGGPADAQKRPDMKKSPDMFKKAPDGQARPDFADMIKTVNPSDTDPDIDAFTGPGLEHTATFDRNAEPKGQLVVYLPGTNGSGKSGSFFCTHAARMGFHSISLTYPSSVSISTLRISDDPDAFRKARENILFGKESYKTFETSPANSIQNRLLKLLRHLDVTYPGRKWGDYINRADQIAWRKVIVSGQSQGGGHAALLATKYRVARAVMFASVKDNSIRLRKPAAWLGDKKATSIDRFFCFNHTQDDKNGCTYQEQLDNYAAMGLSPKYEVVDVDNAAPPYGNTRLLTSTRATPSPHGAVSADIAYRDVWRYMLTTPVE